MHLLEKITQRVLSQTANNRIKTKPWLYKDRFKIDPRIEELISKYQRMMAQQNAKQSPSINIMDILKGTQKPTPTSNRQQSITGSGAATPKKVPCLRVGHPTAARKYIRSILNFIPLNIETIYIIISYK